MSRRARIGQRGTGLILVLGIGLLVMGMAALAHSMFRSALNTSTRHLAQEQSLHLAEEGVDETVAALAMNPAYNTDATFGAMPSGDLTPSQEEAWVRAALAAAPASAVRTAPGGEVITIKPANRYVIYSAGYVPSRAAARRTRVVKSEYLPQSTYSPSQALLAGDQITVTGNPVVGGLGGSVHTNADMDITGNPTVAGDLTASGELTEVGSVSVGGTKADGVPALDMPSIDPRSVWIRHARSAVYAGHWWDLCPDGSVRLPDGAAPCEGSVAAASATTVSFRGWRLSSGSWTFSGNDGTFHGVYYAYRRGMRVTGNPGSSGSPWMATLISEAEQTGTSGECPVLGSGDVSVTGNTRLVGFLEGLALMAGRDLQVSGNATQRLSGVMAAHEQFDLSGNPALVGSVIGESTCSSPASQYSENTVSGNPTITYDLDLEIPAGGDIRTTLWLEL
jgi:Tfp pilus assembly protein PilX